jgi:hypothetical protein
MKAGMKGLFFLIILLLASQAVLGQSATFENLQLDNGQQKGILPGKGVHERLYFVLCNLISPLHYIIISRQGVG